MRLDASQFGLFRFSPSWFLLGVMMAVCPFARALEHVPLKNGFGLDCVRREAIGDKVRLYLAEQPIWTRCSLATTITWRWRWQPTTRDRARSISIMGCLPIARRGSMWCE